MTLRKIVSIKNIGRFSNSSAAGDVEFKKFTLIYGENGRGKTTICAVLRSLQSGDAAHIIGRTTLGISGAQSAHLLLHGQPPQTQFQQGAWTDHLPSIVIYDQTFVTENVYVGEGVGVEQKRNLYKVIVGRDAVQKATRLDELVRDIRLSATAIRDATAAVASHLPPGLKLKDLLDAVPDAGIDEKITKAELDLRGVKEVEGIAKRAGFSAIVLPAKPINLVPLLRETLDSVSASVDQQIQAHLSRHTMRSGGQAWVSQGMEFHPEEGCPFCGQDLTAVTLVDAYKVLFSDGYRALKSRVTEVGKDVAEKFADGALHQIGSIVTANRETANFWKTHAALDVVDDNAVANAQRIATDFRDALLKLLRQKVTAPLEPLELDDELLAAEGSYDTLIAEANRYNVALASADLIIERRKTHLGTISQADANARVEVLKVLKRRHETQLKGLCDKVVEVTTKKDNQEKERDAIKKELDAHSTDVVAKYQKAINKYLELFNAGFLIAKVDHNYVGGVNASYVLSINGVSVALGDEKTPLSKPSFKNTLSSGDKSTLALALFLAQLENDPTRTQRIAVFDDPFNSQDSFRRNQTAIEIARLASGVRQVLVLSHDARFLMELSEKLVGVECKVLKLNAVGDTTEIGELDLKAFLQSEIRALINILQTFHSGAGGEARDVIQKVRPVLEAYCQNTCVTLFEPQDILSGILTKIRTTGPTHPLHAIYTEVHDINDFTCRYHHADGSVTGVIDETELRGYVRRTLKVVGAM